jgi:hypothetical protein
MGPSPDLSLSSTRSSPPDVSCHVPTARPPCRSRHLTIDFCVVARGRAAVGARAAAEVNTSTRSPARCSPRETLQRPSDGGGEVGSVDKVCRFAVNRR